MDSRRRAYAGATMRYLLCGTLAWFVLSLPVGFLVGHFMRRDEEEVIEYDESALELSGDDDGSGLEPHQR